jgi:hypothetical protein
VVLQLTVKSKTNIIHSSQVRYITARYTHWLCGHVVNNHLASAGMRVCTYHRAMKAGRERAKEYVKPFSALK